MDDSDPNRMTTLLEQLLLVQRGQLERHEEALALQREVADLQREYFRRNLVLLDRAEALHTKSEGMMRFLKRALVGVGVLLVLTIAATILLTIFAPPPPR